MQPSLRRGYCSRVKAKVPHWTRSAPLSSGPAVRRASILIALISLVGLSACGIAERQAGESDRAYAERLFSECSDEHSSDVSSDQTIHSCWDESLDEAVDNGDLPPVAAEIGSKGVQLSDLGRSSEN